MSFTACCIGNFSNIGTSNLRCDCVIVCGIYLSFRLNGKKKVLAALFLMNDCWGMQKVKPIMTLTWVIKIKIYTYKPATLITVQLTIQLELSKYLKKLYSFFFWDWKKKKKSDQNLCSTDNIPIEDIYGVQHITLRL